MPTLSGTDPPPLLFCIISQGLSNNAAKAKGALSDRTFLSPSETVLQLLRKHHIKLALSKSNYTLPSHYIDSSRGMRTWIRQEAAPFSPSYFRVEQEDAVISSHLVRQTPVTELSKGNQILMQPLKVRWVPCKTHGPSELHMQADLPEFLIFGLVFLLGQANGKPTRRKLSFAFFLQKRKGTGFSRGLLKLHFLKK